MNKWRQVALEEIADVQRGKFSVRPRNNPAYYDGETPFVQTGDIASAETYLTKHSQTLNELGVSVSKIFPANTILMTIAASIGEVALTTYPVAAPDSVVGILPNPAIADTYWLLHVLKFCKEDLDRLAPKNAQKNINLDRLRPLKLELPPLIEQKRIASVLMSWTRAIDTSARLIDFSRQQKKAVAQQLLTGKRRLGNFTGNWAYLPLSEICERVKLKNQVGIENVLTISAQQGLISQRKYFKKSVASKDLTSYTHIHQGDFAYNKSYSAGYPLGAIKELNLYSEGVVSSLYICFRRKKNSPADQAYLRHYFECGMMNREIYAFAQEGARNHGLLNIALPDFFNCRLELPGLSEQKAIAKILESADDIINGCIVQKDNLEREKRALMQQLLTGKRRIKKVGESSGGEV